MQNFRLSTAHLKFHQICTLIGSLKYKILAKNYRGVISHYPEDWCKIWRKTDLFQKWQEFRKIWPKHSKIYKTCTFICSYCAKYLMFNLKKVQRSYLSWHWMVMQNLKKNWLVVWKMIWGIWQIFTRALQSLKIGTLMGPLIQNRKRVSLKLQRTFATWQWGMIQNLKRKWLVISKLTWGICQILTRALESLKKFHFNMALLSKVYVVWTKEVQMSYLSWHWKRIQHLERNRLPVSKLT